jgi:hypothetical protein
MSCWIRDGNKQLQHAQCTTQEEATGATQTVHCLFFVSSLELSLYPTQKGCRMPYERGW